jgi:glycosyltransferase involved in cell wall biosynthesis
MSSLAHRRVAIVIPCYHSSASLEALVDRIIDTLQNESRLECILVDDASPDETGTWSTIHRLGLKYPDIVRGFRLARNVGQHSALLCGMARISTETTVVVTMDDDLQQLPEDIPELLQAIDDGADLAIGAYPEKKHDAWRNMAGSAVDGTLRRLFGLPRSFQLTSFRAFRRYVAEEAVDSAGRYSYITGSLLSVARRRVNIPVRHEARKQGRSGYTLLRSMELALNLYLTYSRAPLYLIFALFLTSMSTTLTIVGWTIYRYITTTELPMGWASQMVMIGMACTLNLVATAIVALFVTRSHRVAMIPQERWRIAENTVSERVNQ